VHSEVVIVELRSVPDCPNLAQVRTALHTALADLGLPTTQVTEVVGDYPSPSVLIDGVDVLRRTGVDESAACRLDLPTVEHLRAVLRQAMLPADNPADDPAAGPFCGPADDPAPATDCCGPPGDAIRADRPRRAADLPDGPRQVHRAILRHFATIGTAPGDAEIRAAAHAAGLDPAAALRSLVADDLVAVDGDGRLVAAYPFSPTPTPHWVRLGPVETFAMCAIDALGIPYMLDTDAVITSADPHSGQPVQVAIAGGRITFRPSDAVVVYAATGAGGRSIDTCCTTINFFVSAETADGWIAAHPGLTATVLSQDQAVALGRTIFETLLT
jgi:hypothetical protein